MLNTTYYNLKLTVKFMFEIKEKTNLFFNFISFLIIMLNIELYIIIEPNLFLNNNSIIYLVEFLIPTKCMKLVMNIVF